MLYCVSMPTAKRPARIGFLLTQLGSYAADTFGDIVRTLGVTPAEAGVIRVLAHTPGLTQRQLADRLGALPSRVVALIDGLERKGLAARTRSTSDRRVQRLDLTADGARLLGDLRRAAEAQEHAVTEGLTDQQRADLYDLLATVGRLRGLDAEVHPGYARDGGGQASASRHPRRPPNDVTPS